MTRSTPNTTSDGSSRFPSAPLPPRAGAGLKTEHIDAILSPMITASAFSKFMQKTIWATAELRRIAPLQPSAPSFRFRSMALAFPLAQSGGIDPAHLERLARVVDRYQPGMVSEHLAWSSHDAGYFNDLLPVPYDTRTLERVTAHIGQVQDRLKRQDPARKPVDLCGLRSNRP
jgi:uncharacterized protein (UPF0276 family)